MDDGVRDFSQSLGVKGGIKNCGSIKGSGFREVTGNFRVMDSGDLEILVPSGYSVRFERLVSGELEYIIFERS